MDIKEVIEYLELMKKEIDFNKLGYVYGNEAIATALKLLRFTNKVADINVGE